MEESMEDEKSENTEKKTLWDYFNKCISNDNGRRAQCVICNNVYSYISTTHNLKTHLLKVHKISLDETDSRRNKKPSKPKRCLKPKIFNHFTVNDDDKVATCNYCGNDYSYKSTSCNLSSHLSRKHPAVFAKLFPDRDEEEELAETDLSILYDKMTNITERLIEFVKQQPCLYDSSHREYKNVANKTEIWEAIGKELNCTGEVVKNKWRTLRDGYTKNRKLMKEKGISKTYFWAPQLAFLENHLQRQPALNATSSPTPFCMDLDTNAGEESRASPVECKVNTVAEIPLEEPLLAEDTSAPDIRPAKRKNPEDDDDLTRIMNFLSRKKRNEDAVGHLFSSYAVTFRSFPAHEQIALKLKLAELFSNVELKLIEETERRQCILSGTDDQGSLKADDATLNQSIKVKVEPVDRTDIYHEDGPFAHNTTEANLATSADQEKILELLRQLKEKDVELNKAKDQIVALKNEVDALRTRNHSLETRNASLEAAVDDLKIRLNVV